MKTNLNTSLINGEYTVAEAREILMNLYSNKIKFHDLKTFNSMIRFGVVDENSKGRLTELKKCVNEITELLNSLDGEDYKLSIKSTVQIELLKVEAIK